MDTHAVTFFLHETCYIHINTINTINIIPHYQCQLNPVAYAIILRINSYRTILRPPTPMIGRNHPLAQRDCSKPNALR